jgi:hypothetical protein
MKTFINNLLIFILPVIFLALASEVLIRLIPNDYILKKNYLDKNSDKIEVLILGSSHSFFGLNPVYFSNNCFNASYVSQSLDYDLEILKKYDNKWSKLKTVVLPVSYFSLFEKLKECSESWRVKNYTLYYKMKASKSFKEYSELLSSKLEIIIKRLNSYYIKGENPLSSSPLGWGNVYNSKDGKNLIETGKFAAKWHTYDDYHSYPEIVSTLQSIIRVCNKNNVRIILFTPPAYETYRDNLNKDQLNLTIQKSHDIANSYNNCTYINLLADTSFKATDFYDADHLNEIGAKKLSLLINGIIVGH